MTLKIGSGSSLPDYGQVTVTRRVVFEVDQADPIVGISAALLADADPQAVQVDPHGCLVIAGQVTYRPVGFADGGKTVICEKVRGE